jgi:hypothetical protein
MIGGGETPLPMSREKSTTTVQLDTLAECRRSECSRRRTDNFPRLRRPDHPGWPLRAGFSINTMDMQVVVELVR